MSIMYLESARQSSVILTNIIKAPGLFHTEVVIKQDYTDLNNKSILLRMRNLLKKDDGLLW